MDILVAKKDLSTFSRKDILTLAKYYNLQHLSSNDLLWTLAIAIHNKQNSHFPKKASMPEGCSNEFEPIDEEEDIPPEKLIRYQNICWDADNLARYIVYTMKGEKRYAPGTTMLPDTFEGHTFDDLVIEQIYEKADPENSQLLFKTLNPNIEQLSTPMMNLVKRTGQIMIGRGPVFMKYIRDHWDTPVLKEWLKVVPTQEGLEPPRGMTRELSNILNDTKASGLVDFITEYKKWTRKQKKELKKLHSGLSEKNITACAEGEYCMKMIGIYFIEAYNMWARAVGKPTYDYHKQDNYLDLRKDIDKSFFQFIEDGNVDEIKQYLNADVIDPTVLESILQNPELVIKLVENSEPIYDSDGQTFLIHAIKANNTELVKELVNLENGLVSEFKTPLLFAINNNNPEIVKLLLDAGIDVTNRYFDSRDEKYYNLIWFALENQNADIVKLLVDAGSKVDGITKYFLIHDDGNEVWKKLTPIEWAYINKNIDLVKILLKNVKNPNPEIMKELDIYAVENNDIELQQLLDSHSQTLWNIIFSDDLGRLKRIINANVVDIDHIKKLEYSPEPGWVEGDVLYMAVKNNSEKIVEFLIENGMDVNKPSNGYPHLPLEVALKNRNLNMVKLLLDGGADSMKYSKKNWEWGDMPLGATHKYKEAFEMLLKDVLSKNPSALNRKDSYGNTLLMRELGYYGDSWAAEKLIDAGVDTTIANLNGKTAYEIAKQNHYSGLAKKILIQRQSQQSMDIAPPSKRTRYSQ